MAELKLERNARLYNAGDRISEVLHYTMPGTEPLNFVAGWRLEAPAKEFFTVPDVLEFGDARVYPRFVQLILREDRLGGKGVVLVDANWEPSGDDEKDEKTPIAKTDKDAIAKGNRILERWERAAVQAHCDQVKAIVASQGVPRAAQGLVARLLVKYGVKDPAVMNIATGSEQQDTLEKLQQQLKDQQKLIDSLVAKNAEAKPEGKGRAKTA